MEKLELKINAWLRDHLIPRMAGIFRERCSTIGVTNEYVEYKITRPKNSFYLSDLFFADIKFPGSERKLLIKLPPQKSEVRSRQNYDELFGNEMLFYKRLAGTPCSDFPECYLCGDDPVFGQVIVLENVNPHGYYVSPTKTELEWEYLVSGLQSIGRFHASAYALKEQAPEQFHEIINNIANVRYNKALKGQLLFATQVNERIRRVTRTLRAQGYDPVFTNKIAELFEDCYTNVLMKCAEPVEPIATIVHGDCTINNILYRKTKDESLEAMLVDFALIMYSSPTTDVSTFLYMSASREDIKLHFEKLYKAYYDTVAHYLKERDIWDPIKYSYKVFLEDYKRNAIFGYVLGTFFLPMMTEYQKNNNILEMEDEDVEALNITGGGEVLSNKLVNMLIDMREIGLLDCFVNNNS